MDAQGMSKVLYAVACMLCLTWPASATPEYNVNIDTSKSIFKTSERYLSMTLDQSLLTETPPYGPLNFSVPRVATMLKGLSPAWLRFGGTTTDSVVFTDLPKSLLDAAGVTPRLNIITVDEFDKLAKACHENDLRFLFEFNLQLRYGIQWDPTNALTLLQYISKQPYAGNMDFELGNEPNDYQYHEGWVYLNGSQMARDYQSLLRAIRHFPQFKQAALVGNDDGTANDLFGQFVKYAAKNITAATFHHYYFKGVGANVSDYINAAHFKSLEDVIYEALKYVSASPRPDLPLWIGETSDAYDSGTVNVSDRYVSGFLWLDKLGVSSKMGVGVVMRQAFYGGNYALINSKLLPNPDYWLSYVYKQLVGQLVLSTTLTDNVLKFDKKDNVPEEVRGYAHCARNIKGGVVFYGLSVKTEPVTLTFNPDLGSKVNVYWLTPGNGGLLSQSTLLNGAYPLELQDGKLPRLLAKPTDISQGFTIPPLSFGFIEFPSANVIVCQ